MISKSLPYFNHLSKFKKIKKKAKREYTPRLYYTLNII
ncbi:hypothetical protein ECEC1865_6389 [Escherichia coli EC1865]|nr:hypothetical protein ECEC1865_6389 [Escherichia coli EC1865]